MIAIILAGGEGTRLYPLSTKAKPKQFLKLSQTKYSLFQETINRAIKLNVSKVIIATNAIYKDIVKEQLAQLNYSNYELLLETEKLNTFLPIFATLKYIEKTHKQTEDIIIFPSDHFFGNFDYFATELNNNIIKINYNKLVLFGTKIEIISSNYGYIIEKEKNIFNFIEKPSIQKLENMAKISHNIYVNSGIFLFDKIFAKTIINNFDKNIDINFTKIDNKTILLENEEVNVTYRNSFDIIIVQKLDQVDLIDVTKSLWMDLGNKDSLELFRKNYC